MTTDLFSLHERRGNVIINQIQRFVYYYRVPAHLILELEDIKLHMKSLDPERNSTVYCFNPERDLQ